MAKRNAAAGRGASNETRHFVACYPGDPANGVRPKSRFINAEEANTEDAARKLARESWRLPANAPILLEPFYTNPNDRAAVGNAPE